METTFGTFGLSGRFYSGGNKIFDFQNNFCVTRQEVIH